MDFDATATCPLWDDFIPYILADDAEMVDYLRMFLGYCLTGDVSEQIVPIWYGEGANGRSTLMGAIRTIMGDYACSGTAELVMERRHEAHPTERADLFGRRLVSVIETRQGGRLNEEFLKAASGGDRRKARRMREDFWEFDPTDKQVLITNHRPTIRGTEHAIWRRVKLVPFTITIPPEDRDKHFGDKLKSELSGILNWLLAGCRDWQEYGLEDPEKVKAATDEYRAEQDTIALFIADCCEFGRDKEVQSSMLFSVYQEWCAASKEYCLSQTAFSLRMKSRPEVDKERRGRAVFWIGIGLATESANDATNSHHRAPT